MTSFEHPSVASPVTGYVLASGGAPTASDLARTLRDEFGAAVSERTLDVPGKGRFDAVVVTVDDVTALVTPVDGALDAAQVARVCHPVWWPDGSATAEAHTAHVVITVMHPGAKPEPRTQALQGATMFAVIAAKLCERPESVAVLAASAGIAFPSDEYAHIFERAVTSKQVPTELWTSVWLVREDDGTHSAYTLGLDTFGHADLFIEHTRRGPADLFTLLADTARYIVVRGARFEPGQTIGPSESDQSPLRASHSAFHGREVLEVSDPAPTPTWSGRTSSQR